MAFGVARIEVALESNPMSTPEFITTRWYVISSTTPGNSIGTLISSHEITTTPQA